MEAIMNEAVVAAGILLPVITIVVQAIKQLEAVNNKWLPIISMVTGIAVGVILAVVFNQDLALYALGGFLAGAGSSGLYDALTINKGGKNNGRNFK